MSRHLLHVFPTFVAGGSQVRTVRLMEALGGELRHSVLALDGRTDAAQLVPRGVALELVPAPGPGGLWRTTARLRERLRALRPDVLCTYNFGALLAVLAARLEGRPAVLHHEDGFGADEVDGFKRRRELLRALALSDNASVVVPSRTLRDLATGAWGLEADRVHHIPNGIRGIEDEGPGGGAELRRSLGIAEESVVVGFVGRLRREKNVPRLVEAFASLARGAGAPRPALLVVGDGDERAAVRARARELGVEDEVHLLGHRDDTGPAYSAMDVFALASDTEQMPMTLLEAMAGGLPIAATDVGDVARMLPAEQGCLVVATGAGCTARLARALGELCTDPALAARLGARNREHVRAAYGFEAMVARYRERYAEAATLTGAGC